MGFDVKKDAFAKYGIEPSLQEFIDIWVSPETGKEGTKYYAKIHGLEKDYERLLAEQRIDFRERYERNAALMPGAAELISFFKQKNLPLAVVSSNYGYNVRYGLKKFGLEKNFEFVIGAEDCVFLKPNPEPYQKAVEKLGFAAKDVLVLEDSDTGVQSATSAGCNCIAIPNRFTEKGDFSKAGLLLKSLSEVDSLVLEKF